MPFNIVPENGATGFSRSAVPSAGSDIAGGFSLNNLFSDPNFLSLLAGVGSRIDPEGAGGAIGIPTQQFIANRAAQQVAAKNLEQGKQLVDSHKQVISLLGGLTPKGTPGVTKAHVMDDGSMRLEVDPKPNTPDDIAGLISDNAKAYGDTTLEDMSGKKLYPRLNSTEDQVSDLLEPWLPSRPIEAPVQNEQDTGAVLHAPGGSVRYTTRSDPQRAIAALQSGTMTVRQAIEALNNGVYDEQILERSGLNADVPVRSLTGTQFARLMEVLPTTGAVSTESTPTSTSRPQTSPSAAIASNLLAPSPTRTINTADQIQDLLSTAVDTSGVKGAPRSNLITADDLRGLNPDQINAIVGRAQKNDELAVQIAELTGQTVREIRKDLNARQLETRKAKLQAAKDISESSLSPEQQKQALERLSATHNLADVFELAITSSTCKV